MSKLLAAAAVFWLVSVTAAGAAGAAGEKIGVSLPTSHSQKRWQLDGAHLRQALEAAGYAVDLRFADNNDVAAQIAHLEAMVAAGCRVLVIAPVDGNALGMALAEAKARGIAVIAYDRLIMNTDAVSYYVTFDNFKVGLLLGRFIQDQLGLERNRGPFNIELFMGDTADNNVNFVFSGAMSVLRPHLESGRLAVRSGQVSREQCATPKWDAEAARARMTGLIAAHGYGRPGGARLDAVLAASDSLSGGIVAALKEAGWAARDFPLLTGQDCDLLAVRHILEGTQSMSLFKDTRLLAARAAQIATAIILGARPAVNDSRSYDNGAKVVPTVLCDPVLATRRNLKKLVVGSGYYTAEQAGL